MSETRYWELLAKKLAGELRPEEEAEWSRLRALFPHLRHTGELLEQPWADASATDPGAEAAYERHLRRLAAQGVNLDTEDEVIAEQPASPGRRRWPRAALLATLAGAALLGGWLLARDPAARPAAGGSEVSTRPGSRTRMVLPDSSVVWLNAGSRLTCAEGFGVSNRNTTLTGEAFFDVTHRAGLPFVIQTRDVRIRVLGTAFNVKAYPGESTETSLIRGQVQLTLEKRPGETYRLRPDEKLVVNANSDDSDRERPIVLLRRLEHTAGQEVSEVAWVDNKLVFRDEPLSALAARMERWWGVTVEVADRQLAAQHVSGTFANETLQQALGELQYIVPFHLEQTGGRYILSPP